MALRTKPTLWLPRHLLKKMRSLANNKFPLETGGVLIGYSGGSRGDDVVVVAVSGPGPGANHAALTFNPDHEYQTAEIAREYLASKGVNTYLGDWHTHPRSAAELSRRDKKTLRHIA